jgi:tRNA A-37 threonylcarbamoyl transferase component Bud32
MSSTEDFRSFSGPGPAEDNPRVMEALREYQAAVDAGRRPNKRELLSRYADVAGELTDCLEGLELLRSAALRTQSRERSGKSDVLLSPEGPLGDFRLVQEIGRGGMGVVYEAVQLSLGRRVALKVLALATALDPRQLQRFENEARAAAHLHHGHIVPVFAVGCERGTHYYAMQLIDGPSLAAVIDDLRQRPSPASPAADTVARGSSLTPQSVGTPPFFRAVAAVGRQAAEALEHAHQMGVVHRDVKPANLLLDRRGHLWVADFGLARFQECPGLTMSGDLVGTPRYMSPEQAAGLPVIDPRSDVYSLGATLYELLTQSPAFSGRDRRECLRQILEEEPVAPRRLSKAVPAELETIVLKALAKAPEDRYGSARELADDLARFLDDRPIRARPPGWRQLAAKWARRHRRVVTAAVLGLVAAVVVLGWTTWRVTRAEARTSTAYEELKLEEARTKVAYEELKTEQGRTKSALKKEAIQRARAEENYRKARDVLDYLNRLGVEEMAGKPELQALRRRLLTKLLDYYEAFIAQDSDEPDTNELVEARLQVAELLGEVGRPADALAAFEKAMRDRESRPGGPKGPGRRGGRPGWPPRGIAPLFLLGQRAVQEELKLSPKQAEKVKALLDFGCRPPSNEEAAAAEKGLAKLLRPNQAERLQQIIRQTRGPHGLLDPETARALRLSERQKEKIQAILDRPSPGEPGKHGKLGPPPWAKRPAPWEVEVQVLRVLSADQRARWGALRGRPFRGDFRVAPRPPRRKARGTTTYAYYEGQWKRLPDFAELTPTASGTGRAFDLGLTRRGDFYAFRFEGFFELDREEDCTFTLSSDDGSKLYIDGKLVVDNDGEHPMRTRQGQAKLAKGTHKVVVTFFQTIAEADLAVEIQAPGLGRHNLGDLVAATEAGLDKPAGTGQSNPGHR